MSAPTVEEYLGDLMDQQDEKIQQLSQELTKLRDVEKQNLRLKQEVKELKEQLNKPKTKKGTKT